MRRIAQLNQSPSRAHILTIGNAKGGSGKSTVAMHMATRLMYLGFKVAVLDVDCRQQTLTRFFHQRRAFAEKHCLPLPMPHVAVIDEYAFNSNASKRAAFCDVLQSATGSHDVVLLDCPGADTYLTRVAHGMADTLLTPVNDSFVDLDVLGMVEPETFKLTQPSWYSEMVFCERKRRFLADGHRLDWLVVRNRLAAGKTRNKAHVKQALAALSTPLLFRQAAGLGDRVIFRELFLKGLTLSDLSKHKCGITLALHHLTAHQEVRELAEALNLPPIPAEAHAA